MDFHYTMCVSRAHYRKPSVGYNSSCKQYELTPSTKVVEGKGDWQPHEGKEFPMRL